MDVCLNFELDVDEGETDIDCGGTVCLPCVAGKICIVDDDCFGTCNTTTGRCEGIEGGPEPDLFDLILQWIRDNPILAAVIGGAVILLLLYAGINSASSYMNRSRDRNQGRGTQGTRASQQRTSSNYPSRYTSASYANAPNRNSGTNRNSRNRNSRNRESRTRSRPNRQSRQSRNRGARTNQITEIQTQLQAQQQRQQPEVLYAVPIENFENTTNNGDVQVHSPQRTGRGMSIPQQNAVNVTTNPRYNRADRRTPRQGRGSTAQDLEEQAVNVAMEPAEQPAAKQPKYYKDDIEENL